MPLIDTVDARPYLRCDECGAPRTTLSSCAGCLGSTPAAHNGRHYLGPWLCGGCLRRHRHRHDRNTGSQPTAHSSERAP